VYTNGSAHSDSKRQDGWYDRDRNEYHLGDEGKDDEDEDGDVYHHSDDGSEQGDYEATYEAY
jgi:hypothetical protein